ncbi:MAG: Lrp/AsnC family transcriptional regulator [Paludibacteraceae bacterium]|nr:Lrp/AsnC family transcriptional regulator [Paludibacteraceae bacterium]
MIKDNLDSLDVRILEILSKNAKTPFLEIARICNVSGAAIHQHIQQLTANGVIKGSVFMLNAEKVGLTTCAIVGLTLSTDADTEEVVNGLKKIPEVVECHLTSGKFPITIKMYAKNNSVFLSLLKSSVLQISGVIGAESTISLQECFTRQISL